MYTVLYSVQYFVLYCIALADWHRWRGGHCVRRVRECGAKSGANSFRTSRRLQELLCCSSKIDTLCVSLLIVPSQHQTCTLEDSYSYVPISRFLGGHPRRSWLLFVTAGCRAYCREALADSRLSANVRI